MPWLLASLNLGRFMETQSRGLYRVTGAPFHLSKKCNYVALVKMLQRCFDVFLICLVLRRCAEQICLFVNIRRAWSNNGCKLKRIDAVWTQFRGCIIRAWLSNREHWSRAARFCTTTTSRDLCLASGATWPIWRACKAEKAVFEQTSLALAETSQVFLCI